MVNATSLRNVSVGKTRYFLFGKLSNVLTLQKSSNEPHPHPRASWKKKTVRRRKSYKSGRAPSTYAFPFILSSYLTLFLSIRFSSWLTGATVSSKTHASRSCAWAKLKEVSLQDDRNCRVNQVLLLKQGAAKLVRLQLQTAVARLSALQL